MFNDILTGKATLEPKPQVVDPDREPSIPQVTLTCVGCKQTYPANTGTPPGHCRVCNLAIVEANAAASARALREVENRMRRSAVSHRVLKIIVVLLVGVGLVVMKTAMRKDQRDDAARAAGYRDYSDYQAADNAVYPTDEYSYRVSELTSEMCRCPDLACARNVLAQYTRYIRSSSASDDTARESAERDGARFYECQAKLEAGGSH